MELQISWGVCTKISEKGVLQREKKRNRKNPENVVCEDALCQIASVTGSMDFKLNIKALLIFCAHYGVVAQGVTLTGS